MFQNKCEIQVWKNEYVNKVHGLNSNTSSFGDNSNHVIRFPNDKLKRNSTVFSINGIKKHKTFINISFSEIENE